MDREGQEGRKAGVVGTYSSGFAHGKIKYGKGLSVVVKSKVADEWRADVT